MSNDQSLRDTASDHGDQSAAPPLQQPADPLDDWPRLPDTATVHPSVDLTLDDPCYVPELVNAGNDKHSHRRCIATKKNGTRCASRALHHHLLCPLHQGRMTAEGGARAKAAQAAERQAHAEQVLALQKLGTRAVIAEKFAREAEKVDKAVGCLLDAAAAGDVTAAKALVPYFDQAFGKPTERVEHKYPTSVEEIEQMDEEQLVRLVAEGRRRRLQGVQPVPELADWRRRDPSLGLVDGDPVG